MKAQDLKKSILQYAMQGKLVPQDPNDEPASELLKRIKAEKEQLIKDGKIKKEKHLPPITQDEIPYDLPQGWQWVRLGDIGDWGAGSTPNRARTDYYFNGTIPWLKTGDLNDSFITEIPEKITELALEQTSVKIKPIGSLLIAMYGATIGKLGILTIPATTNQACCACVAFQEIETKFLFYYLLSERDNLRKRGDGGAQPNISREKIIAYLLPLPPLAEQKRIVEKLEEILPLIDEYGKNEEILSKMNQKLPKQIRQSILQYAVQGKLVAQDPSDEPASELLKRIKTEKEQLMKDGKIKKEKPLQPITQDEIPYDLPQGWQWVRLQDICTKIVDGDHNPPTGNPTPTEYLMLSASNINNNKIVELEKARYLTEQAYKNIAQRTNLQYNDILFTIVGTLGRSCIYRDNLNLCFQRSVAVLTTLVFNEYLKYTLDSPYIQIFMTKNATGTAQKGFYLNQVAKLLIPLPPLAEQKRIVAKIEELLNLVNKLEEKEV